MTSPIPSNRKVARVIKEYADRDVNLIYGLVINSQMQDEVSVTVIATGIDGPTEKKPQVEGWKSTEQPQDDIDIPAYLRRKK